MKNFSRVCANCGESHTRTRCPACGSALVRGETATLPAGAQELAEPAFSGGLPFAMGMRGNYWTPPTRTYG